MQGSVRDDVVTSQPEGLGNPNDEASNGGSRKLPRGLQELENCNEVGIFQMRDAVEIAFCCCERPDRYGVTATGSEEPFLQIREVSQCYARSCLGAAREFSAKFRDGDDVDVASVYRPITCSRGCVGCCCCLPEMWIYSPPPFKSVSIRERRSCCRPQFDILKASSGRVYSFTTDCCYFQVCGWFHDAVFQVVDDDGETVAKITKESHRNAEELLGLQNKYVVTFIKDLTAREKLQILAACLLIHLNNFADNKRYCA